MNNYQNLLLSIIIPTKNRQLYCIESIKSIISDIDNRCEIVIQDNSTTETLRTSLEELKIENLVYNYNSIPLSFIDNFEDALKNSSGEYFVVLGDDDSITKDLLPIVEWMKKNDVESLSSSFVVDYIWPNQKITKYKTGYLTIPSYKGSVMEIDVKSNLDALVENGFIAYQSFNLPRTYHGIVKRKCMDVIRETTGRYFGGLTPDIYSTIALSCIIKKHLIIDYPFSIAGACPSSATVNATIGGHSGYLKDAPHFNHRGNYQWEKSVPAYYSVETIWAETAIKALRNMSYPNWKVKFNKFKLYSISIYVNRKYILSLAIKETFALAKDLKMSKSLFTLKLFLQFLKLFYNRFMTKKPTTEISKSYTNIDNLSSSKEILYNTLKAKKFFL